MSEENPINQTDADSLAYVVYTSGSTGTPKGVAVPHRAINRLVCNTNYIAWKPSDKVAFCSNISFDAATFEIWGALLNGAQLVGIKREILLSPQEFAQEIQQQQISVLFLTTALFNQMAREIPCAFRSLRYLLFGGEAVDARCVQAVMKQGAPSHLLHVYGSTENTTFTCSYQVQDVAATTIPIGRAIANTQIYLLDTHLKPLPIGVIGEIYISGDGLARGYLHRPDLTAERFIPNPFLEKEQRGTLAEGHFSRGEISIRLEKFGAPQTDTARGCGGLSGNPRTALAGAFRMAPKSKIQNLKSERLYKTGDLARYLADGNLEFVGRTDDQVKLRGFRIELGEIEIVLKQYPAVEETVVMLRDDRTDAGDRSLVAYVVANRELNLTTGELRDFLKTKLPNFMLPTAFVVLEQLPLTPNGKVDRKALPTPNVARSDQLPRTSVEAKLVQIWAEILKQQVGISDNFFELGGHSLLATQLVSRIRDRFGVQVPLGILFETPTIIGMAQYIEAISGANNDLKNDLKMAGGESFASHNREEIEF